MIQLKTAGKVCKAAGKLIFTVKKYSPQILLGLGVAGYGGSVFFAGKAGEKARRAQDTYIRDHDKKKFIKGYMKAWGPSVGLFAASTASVIGGHNILHGRYLATGAALAATKKAFDAYRERVRAREGVDADICYRHGFIEEVHIEGGDDAENPAKIVHELTSTAPADPSDHYIYVLDERNPKYDAQDLHGTLVRMRNVKEELNRLLETSIDDRMTLREALIRSGFQYELVNNEELARFAGRVGWRWGSDKGDNYISFGPMFEKIIEDPRDYFMGRTPPLIIEFNCDGDIYK